MSDVKDKTQRLMFNLLVWCFTGWLGLVFYWLAWLGVYWLAWLGVYWLSWLGVLLVVLAWCFTARLGVLLLGLA